MGGSNRQTQQVQQQSSPWSTAVPDLTGILGQVGGMIGNTGLNPTERSAISGLVGNSGYISQFTPGASTLASDLLSGGGATNQSPFLQNTYNSYTAGLRPFTDPNNLNPYSTPGFSDALRTMGSDITNQVNGMFAGAGRDLSGQNVQALARGLSQGEGGLIQGQYNQNADRYLGANASGYGAGNTTGGLLSNLNQTSLQNREAGTGAATTAAGFAMDPYNAQLAAEAQARGIPLSYLQGLTGITQPIAGLGGQSSGTTNTSTQVSPVNQVIGGLAGGAGLLGSFGAFGSGGWLGPAVSGVGNMFGGGAAPAAATSLSQLGPYSQGPVWNR